MANLEASVGPSKATYHSHIKVLASTTSFVIQFFRLRDANRFFYLLENGFYFGKLTVMFVLCLLDFHSLI